MGSALQPNTAYWWQVKVWSVSGLQSFYSAPQLFFTGQFDRAGLDYPGQSQWIELGKDHWVSEDKQCAAFHRFGPQQALQNKKGNLFFDFGKSAIGAFEFTATCNSDQKVIILLGERKNEDFSVNQNVGRSNIGFMKIEMALKAGTNRYVTALPAKKPSGYLHSQKLATHYPEVMPFRYVEIQGTKSTNQIIDVHQAALFYYFDDQASSFKSSNQNLNAVWDLCKYTLKATPFLGVYADGNRERMPYEADAYIQQLGHYAVDREYSISRYTVNFLLDHASWPTEWQMHMVFMAWEYYMYTGDKSVLVNRYEDLKRKSLIGLT